MYFSPHTHIPNSKHPSLVQYIYYNWKANTGISLSTNVHSIPHYLCYTFYVYQQIYTDMYPPLKYIQCIVIMPYKFSVLPLFILSSHKSLTTTDLSTVSIILPFLECHTIEIMQYATFQTSFSHLGRCI